VFARELLHRGLRHVAVTDLRGLVSAEIPRQVSNDWQLGPTPDDTPAVIWNGIHDHVRGLSLCRTQSVLVVDHLDRAEACCDQAIERLLSLGVESKGYLTVLFAARSVHDCRRRPWPPELSDRIDLRVRCGTVGTSHRMAGSGSGTRRPPARWLSTSVARRSTQIRVHHCSCSAVWVPEARVGRRD
jgi:hypothetical protein